MTTTTELRKRASRDFTETQWSLVRAAGDGGSPTAAAAALDQLCERYWLPIYVYVRRQGRSKHDAEDLTQQFFEHILAKNAFAKVDEAKGSFRSYLLRAVNNFLTDVWEKTQTQRRGAGAAMLSLDDAEAKYAELAMADLTPENAFDYRWRLTLFERGLKRLEDNLRAKGKHRQFVALKPYLDMELDRAACNQVAHALGLSLTGVQVLAYRFRRDFREAVCAELAETVTDEDEFEEEFRRLFGRKRRR